MVNETFLVAGVLATVVVVAYLTRNTPVFYGGPGYGPGYGYGYGPGYGGGPTFVVNDYD